jgi:hypothetical protein
MKLLLCVSPRRPSRLLKWYFALKYRVFRREPRPRDGRRGLVMLQIDALAYAELRRAIELGYCPTIEQVVREEGYTLRSWFCGLPSATPYCQAGFFHGENDGIPAFRFYDKTEQRVITCHAIQQTGQGISSSIARIAEVINDYGEFKLQPLADLRKITGVSRPTRSLRARLIDRSRGWIAELQ